MALSQPLAIALDSMGLNTYGLAAPAYVEDAQLTADTAKSFAVPSGAHWAIFNSTADIFVSYDTTATLPTGTATTDGSGSELNPVLRTIKGKTTISVISRSAADVTISFWRK